MKTLIGGGLLLVAGFFFGVTYDQEMVVLPLAKEIRAHLEEKAILDRALELCARNKFQKSDYISWAIKLDREEQ